MCKQACRAGVLRFRQSSSCRRLLQIENLLQDNITLAVLPASPSHLEVLSHQPGLKRRVEQRGGHSAEDAPHEEHAKVVPVLGQAAKGVGGHIEQASPLATPAGNQCRRVAGGRVLGEAAADRQSREAHFRALQVSREVMMVDANAYPG